MLRIPVQLPLIIARDINYTRPPAGARFKTNLNGLHPCIESWYLAEAKIASVEAACKVAGRSLRVHVSFSSKSPSGEGQGSPRKPKNSGDI